jgi:hypothetical protein
MSFLFLAYNRLKQIVLREVLEGQVVMEDLVGVRVLMDLQISVLLLLTDRKALFLWFTPTEVDPET